MKFYRISFNFHGSLPASAEFPCITLMTDTWDDFGYRTYHHARLYFSTQEMIDLGGVKILQKGEETTSIPREFSELSEEFCSLGQSLKYYELIKEYNVLEVFNSVRDAALAYNISDSFYSEEGFHTSLLRESSAEKAFYEAKELFHDIKVERNFSFEFSTQLPGATYPHEVSFNFKEYENMPSRLNVIIGKNGTGKTQVLARLANALSGYKVSSQGVFTPQRPTFDKVIAISYSIFDEFEKPVSNATGPEYSYVYCGIRDISGSVLELVGVKEKFKKGMKKIISSGRQEQWKEILDEIIEVEHRHILQALLEGDENLNLSSGQNIIIAIMTEVIAHIEEESILLFDEPELHLHPNAISNLHRMIYRLLEQFNSYAIISTHSPIIIQETPSFYINVFDRNNNVPDVWILEHETFGENLSTITSEVFDVSSTESSYKQWFIKMKQSGMSYEDILEEFNQNLSFNAMTFLNKIFREG